MLVGALIIGGVSFAAAAWYKLLAPISRVLEVSEDLDGFHGEPEPAGAATGLLNLARATGESARPAAVAEASDAHVLERK